MQTALQKGQMHIAIIDDDRAILRSLSLILAGQGYETTVFTNPGEAEQCLINRSIEPDVLLVDYLLPGMNGCRLSKRCGDKVDRPLPGGDDLRPYGPGEGL